jgi:hypothetical protein
VTGGRTGKATRGGWALHDSIPINIVGGRELGFRGYGVKSTISPGNGRCGIEATDGREIGRVYFDLAPRPRRRLQLRDRYRVAYGALSPALSLSGLRANFRWAAQKNVAPLSTAPTPAARVGSRFVARRKGQQYPEIPLHNRWNTPNNSRVLHVESDTVVCNRIDGLGAFACSGNFDPGLFSRASVLGGIRQQMDPDQTQQRAISICGGQKVRICVDWRRGLFQL